jgi:hypothetical protein
VHVRRGVTVLHVPPVRAVITLPGGGPPPPGGGARAAKGYAQRLAGAFGGTSTRGAASDHGGACGAAVSFVVPADIAHLRLVQEACGVAMAELPTDVSKLVAW